MRALTVATALGTALVTAVPASAATLTATPPCVSSGRPITVAGAGFVPGQTVYVQAGSGPSAPVTPDPTGAFQTVVQAPLADPTQSDREQPVPLTAAVPGQPPLATGQAVVAVPKLLVTPRVQDSRRALRIRVRGFAPGQPVYAHVELHKKFVRTRKLGVAKAPCGTLDVKSKLLASLRGVKKLDLANLLVEQSAKPSFAIFPTGSATLALRRPVGYRYFRFRAQVINQSFRTQ